MNLDKKYFSISEVSKIIALPIYKLRYIEKNDPNIKTKRINNRRYYSGQLIKYLRDCYGSEGESIKITDIQMIEKIDELILKFRELLN